MFYNFYDCRSINGLENLDVSEVTNMETMFHNCKNLISLNLFNWNTSNVTKMTFMFKNCERLKELDLNNFNLRNIRLSYNITDMLGNLTSLETIITPCQFDSNNLFQNEFIGSFVDRQSPDGSKNNRELRDIGNLELVTKASDIKPSYIYTRKDSEVIKQTYKLNGNISNILN